jgi:uncharacterized protein YjgD (DUF1641 family)
MPDIKPSAPADVSVSAEVERVIAAAQDALNDDIVTRLSATVTQGLELLDRINRSGLDRALPALARLTENGDLERLLGVARVVAAMEDSLSEDIVVRMANTLTGILTVADKLARNDGLLKLVDLLGRDDVNSALLGLAEAISVAKTEHAALPPAPGGLGGLWRLATDPGAQEALRSVALIGKHLRAR